MRAVFTLAAVVMLLTELVAVPAAAARQKSSACCRKSGGSTTRVAYIRFALSYSSSACGHLARRDIAQGWGAHVGGWIMAIYG